ncbi:MAG: ABC transporter substrate-binding protein [Thermotogaceae bacterium]|nr:ABC transporter substrate-binding protein [Thermotogaceae bacterium]
MKKLFLVAFVVFSLVAFAATLKVGAVLPMTGGISAFGQMAWEGIQVAYELKPTVAGHEVKLILIDNRSEKTEAANAVARATDKEHVVGIIGQIASSHSLAGGAVAEKKHVPMISPTSTNPLVTQGKKYISRACFIDPFQGGAAAVFAFKKLGVKNVVAFTDVEQDYSVGLTNYFIKAFKKFGGKVRQVFYKTGDQDFTAQVSIALKYHPDAIYITGYYPEAALISRQARQLGFKGYILGGDGFDAPELIKIGGEAVDGAYFTTHYNANGAATELSKKFVKMYKEKYGKPPSAFAALAFDAYLILADSLERALSKNPELVNDLQGLREALAKEIRNTKNFEGASGYITINENGDAVKSVVVAVVRVNAPTDKQFDFAGIVNPEEIPF